MKKNRKQKQVAPSPQAMKPAGISKIGKRIIFSGILLLIVGFFLLTKTDPSGQNWASKLSPFIILAGYAFIGIGIAFPEKDIAVNK